MRLKPTHRLLFDEQIAPLLFPRKRCAVRSPELPPFSS